MSGLNTYFIPLTILQEQFWDKLTDAPMAGGKLYFYQDEARTIPKSVYVLTGNPPDYSYAEASPSATCITLSSIGTVDDGLGNNLVIYGYPYDDDLFDGSGNIQLYYMAVYNSDDQFQFAVGGFPNVPFDESVVSSTHEKNFIKNGQFVLNYDYLPITATSTEVAYGGWNYTRSSNTATDVVSFARFGSPIAGGVPSANPRYACNVTCSVTGADSSKVLQIKFNDVNRFSDTAQTLSLFFMAKSASGSSISVNLYKNFGTGGSAPITTQIVASTALTNDWQPIETSFLFGSNVGYTLGADNDDYFSIQVSFNPALTFDVSVTDFVLYLGTERITQYPFGTDSYNDAKIITTFNNIKTKTFTSSGTYTPTLGMNYCVIECWGGGGAGGSIAGSTISSIGAGGGGSGGYSRTTVSAATIGASQTVTIGNAGVPGSPGNVAGGPGGETSVGTLCIAKGGYGAGGPAGPYNPGLGAPAGTGDIAIPGQPGGTALAGANATSVCIDALSGYGGSTTVGNGGYPAIVNNGVRNGWPATGYGAGGSGAAAHVSSSSASGGAGAKGFVVITEYLFTL